MKNIVLDFLDNKKINHKSSKFLLAVSGGADSMCLAVIFNKLKLKFSIAHCNFNIRGDESYQDNLFVLNFCKKNNVSFFQKNFNTKQYCKEHSLSTQMAARELRYNWLHDISRRNKFDFIVLGHHLDDNIETYLMNFIKGTGFRGLHGMSDNNNNLLRPFISIPKTEILKFLKANKIKYREDSSNKSDIYYRNKIRNKILPLILELNPSFKKTILSNIKWMSEHEEIVLDLISKSKKKIFNKTNNSTKVAIKDLKKYLNKETYVYEFFKIYGFNNSEEIIKIVNAQTGKKIFSKSHVIYKNREHLIISLKNVAAQKEISIFKTTTKISLLNDKLKFKITKDVIVSKDSNIATIDYNKLKFPLYVRKWKQGDYFYPFGMTKKKKISDYLIDNKVSLLDKKKVFVLCSEKDIVWLIGHRVDNRYKVEQKTKKVYIVTLN